MGTIFRLFRRGVWACGGLGLPFLAHAQNAFIGPAPLPVASFNGGWVVGANSGLGANGIVNAGNVVSGRVWLSNLLAGEMTAFSEPVAVAGRAGVLNVSARAAIAAGADAAAAVAACVVTNVVCAAGAAAASYAAYRYYTPDKVPGSLFPNAPFNFDPGQDPKLTATTFWRCGQNGNNFNNYEYATPLAACQALLDSKTPTQASGRTCASGGTQNYSYIKRISVASGSGSATVFNSTQTYILGTASGNVSNCGSWEPVVTNLGTSVVASPQAGNSKTCPASVDPLDSRYSLPEGSPVGPDGKCPTARYNHLPMTVPQVATQIAPQVVATPAALAEAVKEAVAQAFPMPATITLTGPKTQTGTQTTTQTTTQTGTQSTVSTPVYNYTYAGNQITYNTTTTSTTTVNNNQTTTTSTETKTQPAPVDQQDPCSFHPSSVGCSELGRPVDQPELYTKKDKTVSDVLNTFKNSVAASQVATALNGFFKVSASAGSCPTWSTHIPFLDTDMVFDFFCTQSFATVLSVMAGAVLVVCGIAAFRIAVL